MSCLPFQNSSLNTVLITVKEWVQLKEETAVFIKILYIAK